MRNQIHLQDIKYTLLIFFSSLTARIWLNIAFFSKFGSHSALEKELWYYYGVASGAFQIAKTDPTYWLMKLIRILPQDVWLNSISYMGSIVFALTGVLMYFLGKRLFNSAKAGFIAGMSYGFFPSTLGLNLANFTHDVIQFPVIILLFLAALQIIEAKGEKKYVYIFWFVVLSYIGIQIGPLILFGIITSLIYIALKQKDKMQFLWFFVIVVLLIRFIFLRNIIEVLNQFSVSMRGINIINQIIAQSNDLLPLRLQGVILHFGVWAVLIVLWAILSYWKRLKIEPLSFLVFSSCIIFATGIARTARSADIGASLIIASLLTEKWFEKISTKIIAVFSILALVFCVYNMQADATENEYKAFKWLSKNVEVKKDKVLIPWDSGYFLEAVSGLRASSTPQAINFLLHRVYWAGIDEACDILKKNNIKYVFVTNRYFGVNFVDSVTDDFTYGGDGSLILRPEHAGITKFSKLQEAFIFKLMDEPEKIKDFALVYEIRDKFSPERIRIYKLK